ETVVRCLAPELTGRCVAAVSVRDARLRGGVAPDFAERLTGRRIEGLARRGKYLLAGLDDGRLWLVHLGMTGRLTLAAPGRADERHDHVVVRLDDGRVPGASDARGARRGDPARRLVDLRLPRRLRPPRLVPAPPPRLRPRRRAVPALRRAHPCAGDRRAAELLLPALPGVAHCRSHR